MEKLAGGKLLKATLSVTAVKSLCSHQKRSKKNAKHPFVEQHDWFQAPPSLDMRAEFSCLPCGLWEFSLRVSASIKDFTLV